MSFFQKHTGKNSSVSQKEKDSYMSAADEFFRPKKTEKNSSVSQDFLHDARRMSFCRLFWKKLIRRTYRRVKKLIRAPKARMTFLTRRMSFFQFFWKKLIRLASCRKGLKNARPENWKSMKSTAKVTICINTIRCSRLLPRSLCAI
jgi:hypothetical protein